MSMADKYIREQDAFDAVNHALDRETILFSFVRNVAISALKGLHAADVVPYSISDDGTMTITVPKGTKRIGRILIKEDVTQYGGMFYPDTCGCFLSSMEMG